MDQNKIIFLYSPSPRSGHNFIAEVLRILISCSTPIGDRSEIPFVGILDYYKKGLSHYYKSEGGEAYLDKLFLNDLRPKILNSGSNVLLKNTSFDGAGEALKLFPDDIHIVSLRDPKDCLVSLFKGMKFKKDIKSRIKQFLLPFGIYHFTYSRAYNKKISASLPNLEDFFIVKYEDIVLKNDKVLTEMIRFFESEISINEFVEKINAIKVINTSYFKEETQSDKLWKPSERTANFKPINREKGFNKLQIFGIKYGVASLRRKMGYIK